MVVVAAAAILEIERPDSIVAHSVYEADLKQEVLFGLVYLCTANSKILSDLNLLSTMTFRVPG